MQVQSEPPNHLSVHVVDLHRFGRERTTNVVEQQDSNVLYTSATARAAVTGSACRSYLQKD